MNFYESLILFLYNPTRGHTLVYYTDSKYFLVYEESTQADKNFEKRV